MPPTLFHKLFNKKNLSCPPRKAHSDEAAFSWPSPELDPTQIRLIVYQDCERRGRNILFDSNAKKRGVEEALITKVGKCCQLRPTGGSSSSLDSCSSSASEPRDHLRFQPQGASHCSSDPNMLGEMMFGSVAMSYKGSTLKIHEIRSPPQLMLSKVFTARTGSSVYGSLNTLQDSLEFISQDPSTLRPDQNTVLNGFLGNMGHSNPMDMPGRGLYDERDSGIARSASLSSLLITPFPSPGSSFSSSCASSYQRRWLRSQTTSLENGVFPRWSVDESFNMSDDGSSSNLGVMRKKKIAIGVIFLLSTDKEQNAKFQEFFFSHFPLFESHMNKLKGATEQAMKMSRRSTDLSQRLLAHSRMVDSLNEFRTTICNLYTMPRIPEPVWLTMMSSTEEKNQLCGHFMRELALLMEQASKNQFLPALLTAVLTNHLAWVPTVMPNGQPPIKIFLEKHSSKSVDMLAKTHPYNPLWAQLGDLYGAIGSPVRLSRTVLVGRRQELVQRILYVLTYFIRCSELLAATRLQADADAQDEEAYTVPGTLITTSLRRGEVEESEYVLVTMHKPVSEDEDVHDAEQNEAQQRAQHSLPITAAEDLSVLQTHQDNCTAVTETPLGSTSHLNDGPLLDGGAPSKEYGSIGTSTIPIKISHSSMSTQKKNHKKSVPFHLREEDDEPKVTFLIGESMSPESDWGHQQQRRVVNELLQHKRQIQELREPLSTHLLQNKMSSNFSSFIRTTQDDCMDLSEEDFSDENLLEPSTMDMTSPSAVSHAEETAQDSHKQVESDCCTTTSEVQSKCSGISQREEIEQKKVSLLNEWEIPRNESSDSALGDSESEDAGQEIAHIFTDDPGEWQEELELPFSGTSLLEKEVKPPSVANFGRTLFGGYCPTYVPDFVLHGIPNDDKLRQSLGSDLNHAVQHPVLDEPIAEAVCIIADTDRWTVQVASSQRRATDNKLGQEVLVSNLVSNLLHSTYQLYRFNMSANFCIMHLEDRLQELYFKSKMLAEYLKGHTRVHVKELGVVLGIESSDLPLLAAIASTHSPYVAQILL